MKIEDYEAYDLLGKCLPKICTLRFSDDDERVKIKISISKRDCDKNNILYLQFINWTRLCGLSFMIYENIKELSTEFILMNSASDIIKYLNEG